MKNLNFVKKDNNSNGITLVALIITIIVLLILAMVSIRLVINGGIIGKAEHGKDKYSEAEIKEHINLAYSEWKMSNESNGGINLKDVLENRLEEVYGAENVSITEQGKIINVGVKNYIVTLMEDGRIEEGQLVSLDIANGSIQIKSNGYIQGSNPLVPYKGRYLITGTTTTNMIKVVEQGTYNIILKDLNIKTKECPLNANVNRFSTGCNVNITLEGENSLIGTDQASGIGFSALGSTTNTNGVIIDSTLTIDGPGKLYAEGSNYMAGIGCGHGEPRGVAGNIVINGGDITARSVMNGAAIGSGRYNDASNIIINDGILHISTGDYGVGIGSHSGQKVDNVVINGGKIYVNSGRIGSETAGSGKVQINGGYIKSPSVIGGKNSEVIISGGVIDIQNIWVAPIQCVDGGNIKFTGGNILARGKNNLNIATFEEGTSNLISYTPKDGTNDLYETPIKLQDVGENKKVTKLTTSDNINYGVKDVYTLEDGMLYLYLPKTTEARTITIEVDGKTYSGAVETKETPETTVTLMKIN